MNAGSARTQTSPGDIPAGPPTVTLGVLASTVSAAATLLLGRATWTTVAELTGHRVAQPEEAVALLATGGACLVCGWLAGVLTLATAALAPGGLGRHGRHLARRLAPAVTRRVIGVLVAATVTGGPLAAVGSPGSAPPSGSAGSTEEAPDPVFAPSTGLPTLLGPEPGWQPTPPRAPHRAQRDRLHLLSPSPAVPADGAVVVRSGDSLWRIAARHLGAQATAAQVAAEWPRWYAANRAVIGDDPDLLLPGQVLQVPAPPGAGTSSED